MFPWRREISKYSTRITLCTSYLIWQSQNLAPRSGIWHQVVICFTESHILAIAHIWKENVNKKYKKSLSWTNNEIENDLAKIYKLTINLAHSYQMHHWNSKKILVIYTPQNWFRTFFLRPSNDKQPIMNMGLVHNETINT